MTIVTRFGAKAVPCARSHGALDGALVRPRTIGLPSSSNFAASGPATRYSRSIGQYEWK